MPAGTMTNRVGAGAAMLVAGHGMVQANPELIHLLGRIGESLLATPADWRIRRLSSIAGERDAADRASLKRHLDEIAEQDVDVLLIVIAGAVVGAEDEPSLVTGAEYREYPEEATLPLRWICSRVRTCRAPCVVIVASLDGDRRATRLERGWLDALGTARPGHVVAVDPSGSRAIALDALLGGLNGAALDPQTGTITLRSISEHLGRVVPGVVLQPSDEAQTLASSPPLAGRWDVRLTTRARGGDPELEDEPEGLVGTVLPGRFQISRSLARGSFGTVYMARQLAIERDVAVKVLNGSVDPGSDLGRLFIQEIQSVGRIDHPNVVRIFQADITSGGRLFYAMELLAGCDLQQIIDRDGLMSRERGTKLVLQLLAALTAAHEVGLVHADIKPANAFVVPTRTDERLVLLDFGLARFRSPDRPVESAGGTPAYMSPEQLRDGRVDHRSDLFAAALVLVTLLCGWRRRTADELVPPLDVIDDVHLRGVLTRALSISPDDRFQAANELALALGGKPGPSSREIAPPFRHLAPFTETDGGRLYGRTRELAVLVEHVLYRRVVIYTAPSGTGKTSLLRAGLVPRLIALGVECVYVACRGNTRVDVARAIWHEGDSIADAAAGRTASEHKKLVVIIDQIEAALADPGSQAFLREVAALDRLPPSCEVAVVVSVREDFLASLMSQDGWQATPVVRLGPLSIEAAREAIVGPLIEQRLAITDELLDVLLADLGAAVAAIAAELRWTGEHAVYPPHLQLACSVLYESLAPGEATLNLGHYRRLGGLDTIVGEHLERVLDSELPTTATATARAVLIALVNANQTRAFRTEAELAESVSGELEVEAVLEALRARGLVVRLRSPTGEPGWELVHDSLVPRVLAWIDRRDLGRRRAIELIRYHLRRSRDDRPSLLGSGELVELRDHLSVVEELETEWKRRGGGPIGPSRLVALSRRTRRLRLTGLGAAAVFALAVAGGLGARWLDERDRRQREDMLSKADLGSFILELRAFDWNTKTQSPIFVPRSELPDLDWQLYDPSPDDSLSMAAPPSPIRFTRTEAPVNDSIAWAWRVEVRGGDALIVVSGRGARATRCLPSTIPLRRLPGYASRDRQDGPLVVLVPTCQAFAGNLIAIEAGPYISGGLGDPPPTFDENLRAADLPAERVRDLEVFSIDRTEVTNSAFRMFTRPTNATAIPMPQYPPTVALKDASGPRHPVANVTWSQARAFCRFLGQDLPTDPQWEKTLRGGTTLGGVPNPNPRRNLPWGAHVSPVPAILSDTGGRPVPVGTAIGDVSPYGVLDLAGNVQEWTGTVTAHDFVVTRGCSWSTCNSSTLATFMAIPNARQPRFTYYELGFRCASAGRGDQDGSAL